MLWKTCSFTHYFLLPLANSQGLVYQPSTLLGKRLKYGDDLQSSPFNPQQLNTQKAGWLLARALFSMSQKPCFLRFRICTATQPGDQTKLELPSPLRMVDLQKKEMTFHFFFRNFRLIGPKISESENPKAQNVLISAFFSGFKWKNVFVRQDVQEKNYFFEKSQI